MEKKRKRPVYTASPELITKAQPDDKAEAPKKKKGCGCGGNKKRAN
ncbi:hypothetical protein [Neobacillus sp. YIM B06451]|nr:hypothetical protein [Neobacillus sp. YIM B06451]